MNDAVNPEQQPNTTARYIMIGGFLGAGKTTSVAKLARKLTDQGARVGLITNDQGAELVDTAMLRSSGFATEEIAGGCFCCRFNSLVDAAHKLTTESRPEVFIAEPVGSCTDLVATVTYPLRRIYGNQFVISPLSVLIDPDRALRALGLESGPRFSEKVIYIYKKQLEEAGALVINKIDSLDSVRRGRLRAALKADYPKAEIFEVSARTGEGLEAWFEYVLSNEQTASTAMEINYQTYGEGEALLGWLNATVNFQSSGELDPNALLEALMSEVRRQMETGQAEVAHLKMTLSPDEGLGGVAVMNWVRSDFVPELSQSLEDECSSGQIIINLRAEAAPEFLKSAVESAVDGCANRWADTKLTVEHMEAFRPGQPAPTHRDPALV